MVAKPGLSNFELRTQFTYFRKKKNMSEELFGTKRNAKLRDFDITYRR